MEINASKILLCVIPPGTDILESVQGHVGWALEQPSVVEGGPAHDRGWNKVVFNVHSSPNQSVFL